MTAAQRRAVVTTAQAQRGLRGAMACRYLGVHRSLLRYVPRRPTTPELTARVRALCEEKPRWGALRLTWRLQRDGWLDAALTGTLRNMAGFRNVLVHGYDDVDLRVVEDVLRHHLDDLAAFVAAVRQRSV